MNTEPIQHGDCILIPVNELPENTRLAPRDAHNRAIAAEGEVTGHAHALASPDASIYELIDVEDMPQRFLKVEGEASAHISHEEHGTLVVPPGLYEIRIAREWDPVEGIRRVMD